MLNVMKQYDIFKQLEQQIGFTLSFYDGNLVLVPCNNWRWRTISQTC